MNQDRDVHSIADLMIEDDHEASRKLVQVMAGFLITIGLLFTGYLNFMLYSRAFDEGMKIFGLIPAFLIEGSLAVFLLGSFVWFSAGSQGKLAKIFGWLMFLIVAANTIVEFNARTNSAAMSDFLNLYSFWGVPLVVPITIAFWKAVIDADPGIQIMRTNRKIAQTLQIGKMNATISALGREQSRTALTTYGHNRADEFDQHLLGSGNTGTSAPAARPVRRIVAQPSRMDDIKTRLSAAIVGTPHASDPVVMADEHAIGGGDAEASAGAPPKGQAKG